MAGGVIVSATAGKDYPGNLTLHVFITCVIAATGGLIFGYDLGISVCSDISLRSCSTQIQGGLNMMFQLSITIGILVADLLNYFFAKIDGWGWRLSLGIALVPALIIIIGSFFLPETPNSLIERDHHEKAKEKLIELRGVPNVDEEFNDLITASEAAKLVKIPGEISLRDSTDPILLWLSAFQCLSATGMNVIVFYAPVLFRTIGFKNQASLMSALITGIINSLATVVSIFTVDKVGRRALYLEGSLQMFICQLVVALAIGLKFGVNGNPGDLPAWYAVIVVILNAYLLLAMEEEDDDESNSLLLYANLECNASQRTFLVERECFLHPEISRSTVRQILLDMNVPIEEFLIEQIIYNVRRFGSDHDKYNLSPRKVLHLVVNIEVPAIIFEVASDNDPADLSLLVPATKSSIEALEIVKVDGPMNQQCVV
ncbi:hypothetical protein GH714_030533 [Hevea brasiliensis]|uniref:Major facilitator superfamily (MFS) profile domain-containing protein n=1 Tax=Hevea brasiliensis TaxID=3981 RepID=A0A6A6N864_HEVBR|nr:hypothetical protein GH714_030533 [Hevea brasiliensis]